MDIKIKYYRADLDKCGVSIPWLIQKLNQLEENSKEPFWHDGQHVGTIAFTLEETIPEQLKKIKPVEVTCIDDINTSIKTGTYTSKEKYGIKAIVVGKSYGVSIEVRSHDIEGKDMQEFRNFIKDLLENDLTPITEFAVKKEREEDNE
jgi:hypothetical protein